MQIIINTSKIDMNNISYQSADLRNLPYSDNHFDFVASMSVIEHVGDISPVISELARITKPNGYIQISTDYWDSKIDCKGIYPYGKDQPEMKIFSLEENWFHKEKFLSKEKFNSQEWDEKIKNLYDINLNINENYSKISKKLGISMLEVMNLRRELSENYKIN